MSKIKEQAQSGDDRTGLDESQLCFISLSAFDSGRWDNVRLMGQKQDKYLLFRPGCLPSKSLHYLTSPLIWQEWEKATCKLVSDWWSWEEGSQFRLYCLSKATLESGSYHWTWQEETALSNLSNPKLRFPGRLSGKRFRKQVTYFLIISAGSGIEFGIRRSVNLSVICRGHFGAQLEYVPASDMSERLFWGRSRRHMVPPLTPLTTYAPLLPALVTAQQTFPVFVQILEEKKGWLPAATTNHISTLASRALLAIPLLALLRFQPDTSFYSHIELCLKHQSCEFHLKNGGKKLWNWLQSLCLHHSVTRGNFVKEIQLRLFQE